MDTQAIRELYIGEKLVTRKIQMNYSLHRKGLAPKTAQLAKGKSILWKLLSPLSSSKSITSTPKVN